MLRISGLAAAAVTLLLDTGKGFLAVWLTARLTTLDEGWTRAAAVAVVLGHVSSPFLGFRGGKAVASFFGAFLYLAPIPTLAIMMMFAIVVAVTGYVSLGRSPPPRGYLSASG